MRIDNVPLDESYFDWLYFRLVSKHEHRKNRNYRKLLKQLYQTPFHILIYQDENRAEDGALLRDEFVYENDIPVTADDEEWFEMDCSVLELIFGVADRMAWASEQDLKECFWELMRNLDIAGYTDAWYDGWVQSKIENTLNVFMERLYYYNGAGGLFPLKRPREDQTTLEIWYQMASYLEENAPLA